MTLPLFFLITEKLNRSNLSVCGGGTSVFSESNTCWFCHVLCHGSAVAQKKSA